MQNELVRLMPRQGRATFLLTGSSSGGSVNLMQECLDLFFETIGGTLAQGINGLEFNILVKSGTQNHYQAPLKLQFNPKSLTRWTVIHELSHLLDGVNDWRFSSEMMTALGSRFPWFVLHKARPYWKLFWYHVGSPPPPCGVDKNFNPREDFAESLTAYIFPDKASRRAQKRGYPYEKWGYAHFHDTPRGAWIKSILEIDTRIT